MNNSILRNGALLCLFALVTTGLIALTYQGTESRVAAQEQAQLLSVLNQLLPADSYNNDLQHDCALLTAPELLGSEQPQHIYRASYDGMPTGMAIETVAPDGYSGKIFLMVGVKQQGQVTGVRVLKHRETPGLGDKIELRVSDWILDFNNQVYDPEHAQRWQVKKDGGQFDSFTGATITPRAVVKATARAVEFYQQNKDLILAADNQCAMEQAIAEATADE